MKAIEPKYMLNEYVMELIAGGCSGLAVDSILFPIDTCKTRLQSESGFWKAGGFKGIYNGITPVLAGSIPTAALFFCVYGLVRGFFPSTNDILYTPLEFFISFCINVFAASVGEIFADFIRVPVELVKQKHQVSEVQFRATDILMQTYRNDGLIDGVYRGYGITIMRDIPFSAIQYPLLEFMKTLTALLTKSEPTPFIIACLGSVAGACAAAATVPLDVAKTRIQLAEHTDDNNESDIGATRNPCKVWRLLYKQHGIRGIFSGVVPRVLWTTIGGFIWFGTQSYVMALLKLL